MTLPTVVGVGSFVAQATGSLTPGLPAGWAADDIFIAVVCARGNPLWPGTGASGWTQIASVSFGSNPGHLRAYWRRAVGGDSAPVGEFDGNSCGRIIAIRGCVTVGTPFEDLKTGSDTGADTSFSAGSGLTTTDVDRLVVTVAVRDGDNSSAQFSGEAQSGVANLTERFDNGTTDGTGGGVVCWTGEAASAGAVGGLTANIGISVRDAWAMFAMIPAVTSPPAATRSQVVMIL